MSDYAIKMRRELHETPEIGFDLPRTLEIVRRELSAMGVEYTEKYGKSGIVATVNPDKSHYTIAVRADMDALPIEEINDVEYKSKNDGKMHACGHDAHTAIALATLKEVNEMRDKISCRIKFIFQPAEEYAPSGAMLMAKDGVMDDIDEIVALHVSPSIPVGKIGVRPGNMNATSDGFTLDFYGKNTHVATQQYGRDAIMMSMRAYNDIELMIVKELSAFEPVIFNVGSIHGGEANNIICDHCRMFCTLRTLNDATANHVLDKIKRIGNAVAETADGRFEFTHKKHYPIVYNDPAIYEKVKLAAEGVIGKEQVFETKQGMGGEDFSYFAGKKPGCMFDLGTGSDESTRNGLHTPNFNIDESALRIGIDIFKKYILNNMK